MSVPINYPECEIKEVTLAITCIAFRFVFFLAYLVSSFFSDMIKEEKKTA